MNEEEQKKAGGEGDQPPPPLQSVNLASIGSSYDEKQEKSLPRRASLKANIEKLLLPTKSEYKPTKGNYSIQVHVIEARDLKGRGVGEMSDPVVKVECFGTKKATSIKKSTLNPRWDEVLYFEAKDLDPRQLESERIKLVVMDANTFRQDVQIGSFEFEASVVYFGKDHEVFRKWVALTDLSDKYEGIQGYLRATIVVLGPGDEQKMHSLEEIESMDESDTGILMPPAIEQTGYVLSINLHCALNLPKMDVGVFGGSCDPYVQVDFGGVTVWSQVIKGKLSPEFNECLMIAVMEPVMSDRVMIKLYDWDVGTKDDLIAAVSLSYREIKAGNYASPRWVHFYGPFENKDKSPKSMMMCQGLLEGSYYRGKLLFSANVKRQDNPKSSRDDDPSFIGGFSEKEKPAELMFALQCDIYSVVEVPVPHKSRIKIEVRCAEYVFTSPESTVQNSVAEYFSAITDDYGSINLSMALPRDSTQSPDIFVYLVHENERICFVRIPFNDLRLKGWGNPPSWYYLKEDIIFDKLKDDVFPGAILLGLRCGLAQDAPKSVLPNARPLLASITEFPYDSLESKDQLPDLPSATSEIPASLALDVESPSGQSTLSPDGPESDSKSQDMGNFTIEVVQAKELPALDKSLKSDPYVKITVDGKSWKTKVKEKELNPIWKETSTFENISWDTAVLVEVYDWNAIMAHTKMGERTVIIRELSQSAPGIDFKKGEWFNISSKYPHAAVYLKFDFKFLTRETRQTQKLAPKTFSSITERVSKSPLTDRRKSSEVAFGRPASKQWNLRLHLFLAQSLKSADSDGFSDPVFIVRCNGAVARAKDQSKTLNPEWYETLSLPVSLPHDMSLCPDIHCIMYDKDFGGRLELLGRFSISIAEVLRSNVTNNDQLNPTWYDLFDADRNPVHGKVLIAIQLLDPKQSSNIPDLRPKKITPMFLEISTLGLRRLKGNFVKKPRVEFKLPNGTSFKTRASSIPSPVSPNILQVLKIPLNIPDDIRMAPVLTIRAIDEWFGGSVKQSIGNASVHLGEYYQKYLTKKQEEASKIGDEKEAFVRQQAITLDSREEMSPLVQVGPSTQAAPDVEIIIEEKKDHENKLIDDDLSDEEDEAEEQANLLESEKLDKFFTVLLDEKVKGMEDGARLPYLKGRNSVTCELENALGGGMNLKPFEEFDLRLGKKGKKAEEESSVGTLKGICRLVSSGEKTSSSDFFKELLAPTEVFVRLYVLEGRSLTPMDDGGSSDPYLVVSLGKKKINLRKSHLTDTLMPKFYKVFEFPCQIPGISELKIEVWDWDGIGDDLIGTTAIDVEDRWFTPEWRALKKKPVEWRTLHRPTSSLSQGKLQIWLDILTPAEAKRQKIVNIKPPAPLEYELRVIVWKTEGITIKDEITEQNDLYLTGLVDIPGYDARQRTDTHLRSKLGKGSFNWRMIFPVVVPLPDPRFKFQVWDMDFFSANDSICEATVSLRSLFNKAISTNGGHVKMLGPDGNEKIWIDNLRHPNYGGKNQGKVQVSFELLPKSKAVMYPAGLGRNEPNQHPSLPEPEGRMQFDPLNPLGFIKDLLGDKIFYKCCLIIWCGLLISAMVFFGPTLMSAIVANVITGN